MKKKYDYCIVGSGPSGLTCAYQLLKAGRSVLLVERDDRIGGLAKSYDYDGQIFDTGPKRFHTDDQIVLDFIDEIAQDDICTIGRSTKVHFLNRYFEWPLQTKELFKMPLHMSIKCMLDLLKKREFNDKRSFKEFIISKYGVSLYNTFFAPYTSKFLRWDVEDIHSDWASTGINRTIIDKRVDANTLISLVRSLLLPSKVETEFLYPLTGGFGGFYERLLQKCEALGGFDLILSDTIESIQEEGATLSCKTKQESAFDCGDLIWTGNLNDLGRIVSSTKKMHYLNTVFYNIICKDEGISNQKAQWIYVSRGDSLISRITCMKEFAPYTCQKGYSNFLCEVTDSQSKPHFFHDPDAHTQPVLDELVSMRFLKGKKHVEAVHVNAVKDTYPIYHKQYNRDFGKAAAGVMKFSKKIHLLGRCGAFWYNNSDHSIRFAIELADKLLGKTKKSFDYRQYFGGAYTDAPDVQEAGV